MISSTSQVKDTQEYLLTTIRKELDALDLTKDIDLHNSMAWDNLTAPNRLAISHYDLLFLKKT